MSAFTLKIIALISMIVDHMSAAMPQYFPIEFRMFGRLAWPIFAFLLAEGLAHTTSKQKLLVRLFVFALISEAPFDLALGNQVNFLANTNIFYTLFLGGAAITVHGMIKDKVQLSFPALFISVAPLALLADFLGSDYGALGVLFIFSMNMTRHWVKPKRLLLMAVFALSQFHFLLASILQGAQLPTEFLMMIIWALGAVALVAMYNGKRGFGLKWLFYVAYPAHLAILALIIWIR